VASHNVSVCLRLFSLPEIPRGDVGRRYVTEHYEDISELWTSHLDGLIVTGTEPRAAALADEPYWLTFTQLIDWAEDHTVSTVWSCLAAHAAVLHADGIGRQALRKKLSGVFDCIKAEDHLILAGTPSHWCVPHSRYNDLPEEALTLKGYRILAKSADAGVDMFVKQKKSLFVFLQGHPEYDSGALLREYRRDIARFLSGEQDSYPEIPCSYFDEGATAELAAFRQQALQEQYIGLLSCFPAGIAERTIENAWRVAAGRIYSNWLSYLIKQRSSCVGLPKSQKSARVSRDLHGTP
jgi:homoserine O-succinyltransferase